jgi:hypothetical protein
MATTTLEALKELHRELGKYGQGKVLFGKWTLKDLARFVSTFNNSSPEDLLVRRSIIGTLMSATHVCEIRIPNVGSFESESQARRNGPMIPGPRKTKIELDFGKNQLNILERRTLSMCPFTKWETGRVIPLSTIKRLRIVRVPAGLRHLEIALHTPCPD